MKQYKTYLPTIIIALILISLSGCLPKQKTSTQTFLLQQPTVKQDTVISTEIPSLHIEKITAIAPFDSLNFIFKMKPTNYQLDYYHRFLSTPSEQLGAMFTTKLEALPNVKIVSDTQTANYLLKIRLNKFYIDSTVSPKRAIVNLGMQLTAQNDTAKLLWWHDYQQSVVIKNYTLGAQNIVLAWNKDIQKILQQSTKEIVQHLPKQPLVPQRTH